MSPEPTEAERAVVDVLEGDSACTWHKGCDVEDCHGPRAAAIVAKLRPILAAEALREAAEALDKLVGSAPLETIDGLILACNELCEMAAALRTTTPEHKGDPR